MRARIEELKKDTNSASKKPEVSVEELAKKKETLESEEGKVLRRLYLLIKQIKPSLKSECLTRVAEVISQNATISITQEGVDRLLPFSDQTVVKLLKEYTQSYYCLSKSPLTMWTHIRFPSQTMVLLSRDITDFTKEGNSTLNTHSHQLGPYIFRVAKSMNKIEIKEYLQKIYGVRVTRVNTSNMLGIHTPHHTS